MSTNQLRYIVFLLDSTYKDHDGKVFASYEEAKAFLHNQKKVKENFYDKAVIGMFKPEPITPRQSTFWNEPEIANF